MPKSRGLNKLALPGT